MFSYHGGHSGEFCRHAEGKLEDVVLRAIALGFSHYGLTEHCPRYRSDDLFPDEQDLGVEGLIAAFDRYVLKAVELQSAYADRIELLLGFETERVPPDSWERRMHALRMSGPFDYVVGSVHDIDGRWIDLSPEATEVLKSDIGGTEALHVAYFGAVADMVERLQPEVVAHLDLVRKFEGSGFQFASSVQPHVQRSLDAIRSYGGILDVNCAGFRRGLGPVYPLPWILDRSREMGIRVTLGDDSHGPDTVGVGLAASIKAISDAGYTEVHRLTKSSGWIPVPIGDLGHPVIP